MNQPRKNMKSRWSLKYKRSINCSSPKGFSQKNYCKRQKRGGNYLEGFKEYFNEFNYLSIGHNREEDIDAYVLKRDSDNITTAKKTGRDPEYFHAENLSKKVDFSGRIDHKKQMVSISQQYGNDERLNYLISILKQDFPGYTLWYFSHGYPKKVG